MHIVCAERKSDRAETWKDSEGLEVTPPGWLTQGNAIPSHSRQTGKSDSAKQWAKVKGSSHCWWENIQLETLGEQFDHMQ